MIWICLYKFFDPFLNPVKDSNLTENEIRIIAVNHEVFVLSLLN